MGKGSLNLSVAGPTTVGDPNTAEKIVYGNEVDFFGQTFNPTAVGFQVYNNVENGPNNMPGIDLEIDPNLTGIDDNFTTLTFIPANGSLPGLWSNYIDATTTGLWGATGVAGGAFAPGTPCNINTNRCSWTELKAVLADGGDPPTLLTVGISKGRDNEWHGAVDGLQFNGTVYDFEEYGVIAIPRTAPVPTP
nr:MetaGeneMark_Unknown Function [uncultured bacterium]